MTATIPGWSPALERAFKEVLFRFLEEVHCTKAAVYLLADDGGYLLAAQYGFGRREPLAAGHSRDGLLATTARNVRPRPVYFNSAEALPGSQELLDGAGTQRLLLVPLYGASRLLGFVDARDKGGGRPFVPDDVGVARSIGGALVRLLRDAHLYDGIDAGDAPAATSAPPSEPEESAAAAVAPPPLDPLALWRLAEVVAHHAVHGDIAGIALTVVDGANAATTVSGSALFRDAAVDALRRHQMEALLRQRITPPDRELWTIALPDSTPASARPAAGVIASAVLEQSSGEGARPWALVVSVVGEGASSAPRHVVRSLQQAVDALRAASTLRWQRLALARALIRPPDEAFRRLTGHSEEVARIAWRIASLAADDPEIAEDAAVAGLLHDVGALELGTELYDHPSPDAADRYRYREHPELGARRLRRAGLSRLASAVRHHHERWDGTGYPDRLAGDEIPLLSRIVALAEAWDTLVGAHSYRRPLPPARALAVVEAAAGTQFDPALVPILGRLVR